MNPILKFYFTAIIILIAPIHIYLYFSIPVANQQNNSMKVALEKIQMEKSIYDKNYIENYPEMKSIINRYNNCKAGLTTAVEGCLEYATTDKKQQLNDYLIAREKLVKPIIKAHNDSIRDEDYKIKD